MNKKFTFISLMIVFLMLIISLVESDYDKFESDISFNNLVLDHLDKTKITSIEVIHAVLIESSDKMEVTDKVKITDKKTISDFMGGFSNIKLKKSDINKTDDSERFWLNVKINNESLFKIIFYNNNFVTIRSYGDSRISDTYEIIDKLNKDIFFTLFNSNKTASF